MDKARCKLIWFMFLVLAAGMLFAGCERGGRAGLDEKPLVDLSVYESMQDTEETCFVDITADEILARMDAKESFVVFAGYAECGYCNRVIPYINRAAEEANVRVGYLDTRKNPEWQSNVDIDDYDRFAERFANLLSKDDDGSPHLYVPVVYFIKKGTVVALHEGVTEGADDPDVALTSEQEEQLMETLAEGFEACS